MTRRPKPAPVALTPIGVIRTPFRDKASAPRQPAAARGTKGRIELFADGRYEHALADLAAMNINLVGGDPYGGDCALDQYLLWRPLRATRNHATPVAHLWHIGASTHPGPGLGGASGFHVAQALGAA